MASADILSPLEQEGTKSIVRAWLKQPGETVRRDDPIVELETDKVSVEVSAPADGVLAEILLVPGADAPPGTVLGRLNVNGGTGARSPTAPLATKISRAPLAAKADRAAEDRLSPSVRRMLREKAIDPATITGTGRDGRITFEDVARLPTPSAPGQVPSRAATIGGSRRVPHSTMRRRIAEHMVQSLRDAPHVTAVFEADFTALQAHRNAHKSQLAERGVSLTYLAYIIAACAKAMAAAPAVNSRWHGDELEIFDDVNIAIGISLGESGLVAPVIGRAQALSLEEIAARVLELTHKARAGKLTPTDVQGGTFSISNHGVSGSLLAAPIIINQPQSAILGVGKLQKRVVVKEIDSSDAIQIRPMAYVTLSIDHRVLDGHQTNAWLTRFVEIIETWPIGT